MKTSKNTPQNAVDFRSALNPVTPKKRECKHSILNLITTHHNWTLNFTTTDHRQFSLADLVDFLHSTAQNINVTCRMKHRNVAVHIVFLLEQVVFVYHLNKMTDHAIHVLEELCWKCFVRSTLMLQGALARSSITPHNNLWQNVFWIILWVICLHCYSSVTFRTQFSWKYLSNCQQIANF